MFELVKAMGLALIKCLKDVKDYAASISSYAVKITEADQVIKHELDVIAGMEDISMLITLIERRADIEKTFRIDAILSGKKDLRRIVDQYVANTMLQSISGELTSAAMDWYVQIRTTGDLDVHLDGFDMERTKQGDLKSRRVRLKAKSYGKVTTNTFRPKSISSIFRLASSALL